MEKNALFIMIIVQVPWVMFSYKNCQVISRVMGKAGKVLNTKTWGIVT